MRGILFGTLLIVAFVGMFLSYKIGYKNGYIDRTNEVVAEDSAMHKADIEKIKARINALKHLQKEDEQARH